MVRPDIPALRRDRLSWVSQNFILNDILGLILEKETHFDPREVMTDTAAYSDVVFGLFWVLGYGPRHRAGPLRGVHLVGRCACATVSFPSGADTP